MDNTSLAGKRVVLAISQEDEREAFASLLAEMQIEVRFAGSGAETLQLLEDYPAQLLILDLSQPDMHGWPLINKLREISYLRDLPITVITDQAHMGMTVANVRHLQRPVSIARLRQNVIATLSETEGDAK